MSLLLFWRPRQGEAEPSERGRVWLDLGDGFKSYPIFCHDGTDWVPAHAYVYDSLSESWVLTV